MITNRNFLGIDPGATGGFCILTGDGVMKLFHMPINEPEIGQLFRERILPVQIEFAVLEKVWVMPNQNPASEAKLIRNASIIKGMLLLSEMFHDEIVPKSWQKALGIPGRVRPPRNKNVPAFNFLKPESKSQFKKRLWRKSVELFPDPYIPEELGDAVLLAELARRMRQ